MRIALLILACLFGSGVAVGQNCPAPVLATANNHFAFDMYNILSKEKVSVFYSPYSIFTVLHMTADGAKGTTASEMLNVLHSTGNTYCTHHDIQNTQHQYNSMQADGDTIQTANSLWVESSFSLNTGYVEQSKDWYNASVRTTSFIKSPEPSRLTINSWVEEQTHQRIKDLLAPGSVSVSTRLVLVNTIWLKAKWLTPFKQENTRDDKFDASDAEVKVPFMNNTMPVGYAEDVNMQMIELPYKSNKLSMFVMLPVKGMEDSFAKRFDLDYVTRSMAQMGQKRTQLSLPKFKMTASFTLNDPLKKLGMKTAFTDAADFSGISNKPLQISEVIHKAFIAIDEDGTEAAAATAVTVVGRSIMTPPKIEKIFKADHPFIFFLYDKENKTILFMGRLEKPE